MNEFNDCFSPAHSFPCKLRQRMHLWVSPHSLQSTGVQTIDAVCSVDHKQSKRKSHDLRPCAPSAICVRHAKSQECQERTGAGACAAIRIFSPFSAVLGAYKSTTCSACQSSSQPHQGTLMAHPI